MAKMTGNCMRTITEPSRQVPVVAETEVLVLGGGPAGIAAATAAARSGAKTMLLERYGFLGGMGTAAMVTNFCGLHACINGTVQQIVHGVADDILHRLAKLDGLREPHVVTNAEGLKTGAQAYDNAAYKVATDDLLVSAGVDVRFHTFAVDAITDNGKIEAVLIETKSGRAAISSDMFIDCSGDADLATWAGVPYEKGGSDGFMAYPTMMFRIADVESDMAMAEGAPQLKALIAEANASGKFKLPRKAGIIRPQTHDSEWRANLTQISRDGAPVDGSDWDDIGYAEIEGRKQAIEYFRFLKEMVPGFANAYMLELAPQIGIRETRRIIGSYQLTGEDVLECRDFDDSIGCSGWPLETHVLGDVEWKFLAGRGYHQIPFSTTLPTGIENLLVAGRCASTTQEGQASLRVSGPCFAMGQAAGTAAAMARKAGVAPAKLDVPTLQQQLSVDGVFIGDTGV